MNIGIFGASEAPSNDRIIECIKSMNIGMFGASKALSNDDIIEDIKNVNNITFGASTAPSNDSIIGYIKNINYGGLYWFLYCYFVWKLVLFSLFEWFCLFFYVKVL